MAMVTHPNKAKRNQVKAMQLYMDMENGVKIAWKEQAVLLGVLFHNSGSFGPHIANKERLANAWVRTLVRFNKVISGEKLKNVYKANPYIWVGNFL